jgi:hypothetical protein
MVAVRRRRAVLTVADIESLANPEPATGPWYNHFFGTIALLGAPIATFAGLLSSVWEDADDATSKGRPRRRLCSITMSGRSALMQVEREAEALGCFDPGWSPA